jgi:hypothetical protein
MKALIKSIRLALIVFFGFLAVEFIGIVTTCMYDFSRESYRDSRGITDIYCIGLLPVLFGIITFFVSLNAETKETIDIKQST